MVTLQIACSAVQSMKQTVHVYMQVHLWQFGRLLPSKLGRHMEGHGVLPVLYLSSWLLTSFASDFPLFFSSRVLDVVLTGSYPHAVLRVSHHLQPHAYYGITLWLLLLLCNCILQVAGAFFGIAAHVLCCESYLLRLIPPPPIIAPLSSAEWELGMSLSYS